MSESRNLKTITEDTSKAAAEAAKKIIGDSKAKPRTGMTVREFCDYVSEFTVLCIKGYAMKKEYTNPRDPDSREEIISYTGTKKKLLETTVWNSLSNSPIILNSMVPVNDHGIFPLKIMLEVLVE